MKSVSLLPAAGRGWLSCAHIGRRAAGTQCMIQRGALLCSPLSPSVRHLPLEPKSQPASGEPPCALDRLPPLSSSSRQQPNCDRVPGCGGGGGGVSWEARESRG